MVCWILEHLYGRTAEECEADCEKALECCRLNLTTISGEDLEDQKQVKMKLGITRFQKGTTIL